MRREHRKHAVKQNLPKKWTAVKIILQKKTAIRIINIRTVRRSQRLVKRFKRAHLGENTYKLKI